MTLSYIKYFFLLCSLLFVVGCNRDSETFSPLNHNDVESVLRSVVPANSTDLVVSNKKVVSINTDLNAQIEIGPSTFFENSESNDIEYNIKVIELGSFSDYILQNATSDNNLGLVENIYGAFIHAEYDNQKIEIRQSKNIVLRIPSEMLPGKLRMGYGVSSDESGIFWNFNNGSEEDNINYTSWTDAHNNKISGYEIKISKSGWVCLSRVVDQHVQSYNQLCANFDENFTTDNTQVYLLSKSHGFIQSGIFSSPENPHCIDNIPFTDTDLTLISITFIEDESQVYYSSQDINLTDTQESVSLSPVSISMENLQRELLAL